MSELEMEELPVVVEAAVGVAGGGEHELATGGRRKWRSGLWIRCFSRGAARNLE